MTTPKQHFEYFTDVLIRREVYHKIGEHLSERGFTCSAGDESSSEYINSVGNTRVHLEKKPIRLCSMSLEITVHGDGNEELLREIVAHAQIFRALEKARLAE